MTRDFRQHRLKEQNNGLQARSASRSVPANAALRQRIRRASQGAFSASVIISRVIGKRNVSARPADRRGDDRGSRRTEVAPGSARDLFEAGLNEAASWSC